MLSLVLPPWKAPSKHRVCCSHDSCSSWVGGAASGPVLFHGLCSPYPQSLITKGKASLWIMNSKVGEVKAGVVQATGLSWLPSPLAGFRASVRQSLSGGNVHVFHGSKALDEQSSLWKVTFPSRRKKYWIFVRTWWRQLLPMISWLSEGT